MTKTDLIFLLLAMVATLMMFKTRKSGRYNPSSIQPLSPSSSVRPIYFALPEPQQLNVGSDKMVLLVMILPIIVCLMADKLPWLLDSRRGLIPAGLIWLCIAILSIKNSRKIKIEIQNHLNSFRGKEVILDSNGLYFISELRTKRFGQSVLNPAHLQELNGHFYLPWNVIQKWSVLESDPDQQRSFIAANRNIKSIYYIETEIGFVEIMRAPFYGRERAFLDLITTFGVTPELVLAEVK